MKFLSKLASLTTLALASAWFAPSAGAQCIGGGPGGAIPDLGDGIWDNVLPTGFTSNLTLTVPAGATVLKALKINGLSHTWGGDLQFVIEAPSGAQYNVVCGFPIDASTSFSATNLELVDAFRVGPTCGGPSVLSYPNAGGPVASGTYGQEFGGYTNGMNGITNTALESIPIASGTWKLHAYDWAAADAGTFASWELCFGQPSSPPGGQAPLPPAQCVTGGAGGSWPIAGVDGVWPNTLPTGQLVAPLAVTLPAGATKIVSVKVLGYNTTWVGDQHFVLQSPAGVKYNLFYRPGSVTDSYGLSCWATGGDYTFVQAGTYTCPYPLLCSAGQLPAGIYDQSFGDWPGGAAGINNVALGSIPIASGTWNLLCYDWYVATDNGSILGWELCFDSPSVPSAYCTPASPGTSHGCMPSISGSANPNVAHSNTCVLTVSNVEGLQSGIIFYGLNSFFSPWCNAGGNSFQCVKPPFERTGVQNTGGSAAACNGSLSLDWNIYQLATAGAVGQPWIAGEKAYIQGWFRDPPSCKTTFLSQALVLTYQP